MSQKLRYGPRFQGSSLQRLPPAWPPHKAHGGIGTQADRAPASPRDPNRRLSPAQWAALDAVPRSEWTLTTEVAYLTSLSVKEVGPAARWLTDMGLLERRPMPGHPRKHPPMQYRKTREGTRYQMRGGVVR
jgi:hypothetical protein